jgi:hypothetical protein
MTYPLRLDALPVPPLAVTLSLGVDALLGPADPSPFPFPLPSRFKLSRGFLNLKLAFGGVDSPSGVPSTSSASFILTSSMLLFGGTVRRSEMVVGGTSSSVLDGGCGGCGGESISILGDRTCAMEKGGVP